MSVYLDSVPMSSLGRRKDKKMFLFLKSLSRSVHDEEHTEDEAAAEFKIDNIDLNDHCTSLTVWRKSLITSCNGFTVIDTNGNLAYRVDNYMGGRPEEVVLMDGAGKSLLTMRRRKKLTIVHSWLVYKGEGDDDNDDDDGCGRDKSWKRPIYSVKKQKGILHGNRNVLAHVYRGASNKRYAYAVEGSYAQRSCKVVDERRRVVAEIKRKEATIRGVSFGVEVFVLMVHPGFDPGFAMALVLLLDQMFS